MQMTLKIMGNYGKSSAALIIIGIVGLVVALAVGYLFWRGILKQIKLVSTESQIPFTILTRPSFT